MPAVDPTTCPHREVEQELTEKTAYSGGQVRCVRCKALMVLVPMLDVDRWRNLEAACVDFPEDHEPEAMAFANDVATWFIERVKPYLPPERAPLAGEQPVVIAAHEQAEGSAPAAE